MTELKSKLLSLNVFEESTWLDKYCLLINTNKFRQPEKNITNCHHIIPRSLYSLLGMKIDDSSDNKVNLIYSDHLLAHYYLMKAACNKDVKCQNACGMLFAYVCPHEASVTEEWLTVHAEELNEAYLLAKEHTSDAYKSWWENLTDDEKKARAEVVRAAVKQLKTIHKESSELRVPPNMIEFYLKQGYSLGRSDKSRDSVSKAKMGSTPWNKDKKNLVTVSLETRKLLSDLAMGHPVSEETRSRIGAKNRGKIYVSRNGIVKKITSDQLEVYLQDGWTRGSIKNKGMSGKVVVNNGTQSLCISEEDLQNYLSKGWAQGRHDVAPTRGRVSPTAGKVWITNGFENRVVFESEFLLNYDSNYWYRGRTAIK